MVIDAQIPLMVRPVADPAEGMGRAMSLAALAQQGRLQQVQLEQAQREQEDQRSLADLYRGAIGADGKLDRSAVLQGAASRGLGAKIPGLQRTWLETDKAQAELDASQVKTEVEKAKFVSDMVSRLASNPNATRDDVLRELQAAPPQFAQNAAGFARMLPADPQQMRQFLLTAGASADKRIELLTPKWDMRNTGKTLIPFDTNGITNPNPQPLQMTTTPGEDIADRRARDEGAANRSVTIRGQNMVDARARETAAQGKWMYDSKRGGLVNLQTGEFKPATQGGVPLTPETDKPTEDQAKAAGWLVQADNAWKNMQKAMDADQSVTTPSWLPAGSKIANLAQGPERQMFNQGASSFSEALLRAATGAGVNAYEAQQKVAELTPQIGDKPEVVKQKLAAIPIYLESLKVRAGPAGKQAMEAVAKLPKPGDQGAVPDDISVLLKKYGGK